MIIDLRDQGFLFLAQIGDADTTNRFSQAWLQDEHFRFVDEDKQIWIDYVDSLQKNHVRILDKYDELIWFRIEEGGFYTPNIGYKVLREEEKDHFEAPCWSFALWKFHCQHKEKLFMWLVMNKNVPT